MSLIRHYRNLFQATSLFEAEVVEAERRKRMLASLVENAEEMLTTVEYTMIYDEPMEIAIVGDPTVIDPPELQLMIKRIIADVLQFPEMHHVYGVMPGGELYDCPYDDDPDNWDFVMDVNIKTSTDRESIVIFLHTYSPSERIV